MKSKKKINKDYAQSNASVKLDAALLTKLKKAAEEKRQPLKWLLEDVLNDWLVKQKDK
jgi:predicted transcriptional regulator